MIDGQLWRGTLPVTGETSVLRNVLGALVVTATYGMSIWWVYLDESMYAGDLFILVLVPGISALCALIFLSVKWWLKIAVLTGIVSLVEACYWEWLHYYVMPVPDGEADAFYAAFAVIRIAVAVLVLSVSVGIVAFLRTNFPHNKQ